MANQVASLEAVFTANTTNFYQGVAGVDGAMTNLGTRMGTSLQSVGRNITSVGTQMFAIGGAALAGFGVAVNAAISFESAFAGVIKTVDATDEQLAIIRDTIRDMATDATNPVAGLENAHIVLAQIMEAAGQMGVGTDNLVDFTQVMGELGLSTNITAVNAATLTAQFANITGMSFDNVRNFGSAIVALGNSSATTEDAILSMAGRLASAGSLLGMSEADILAFSAALSSAGISAELGGSNFSRLMMELNTVVTNGGAGLARLAEISQTSADEFATAWRNDPTAALQLFLAEMGNLPLEYQTANLDAFGMSGTEMARVVLALSGNTELLTQSLNTANTAWTENTALGNEANTRLQTTEAQMNVVKNQMRDVAITIGEALLPAFNNILTAIMPIITSFGEWAAENPETIQTVATLAIAVTALGAVLIPLGMLITAVGTAMSAAGVIAGVLATGIGLLLSPIGLVVAAVGALALAFATDFLGIRTTVENVINNHIKPALEDLMLTIGGVMEQLGLLSESGGVVGVGVSGAQNMSNIMTAALNQINAALGQASSNSGGAPPVQIPGYASGGVIPAGQMSMVGENGPELIMPAQDTRVTPNHEMSGTSIGNVTIYANDYAGGQAAARGFREELAMQMRASG